MDPKSHFKIEDPIVRWKSWIIMAMVVLSICALWSASRLEIDTGVQSFLPQDSPSGKALDDYLRTFEESMTLLVTIRRNEEGGNSIPEDLVAEVAAQIRRSPFAKEVRRLDKPSLSADDLSGVGKELFFLMDEAAIDRLAEKLDPSEVQRAVSEARHTLMLPGGETEIERIRRDPLGLSSWILKDILETTSLASSAFSTIGTAVLEVIPKVRDSGKEACEDLYADLTSQKDTWLDEVDEEAAIEFTGGCAIKTEVAGILRKDMIGAILGAGCFCFLQFWVWRRSVLPLVRIAICLFFAVAVTAGAGGLLYREISAMGMASAAILLGLCIDFCIHTEHSLQLSGNPSPPARRLGIVLQGPAKGIALGALTTGGMFISLRISGIPALHQMGTVVAIGLSVGAVICILTYPTLIVDKKAGGKQIPFPQIAIWCFKNSRLIAIMATILFVTALAYILFFSSPGIAIGWTHADLQIRGSKAYTEMARLVSQAGNIEPVLIVSKAPSREQALLSLEHLQTNLPTSQLSAWKTRWPSSILPTEPMQRRRLSRLQPRLDGESLRTSIEKSLESEGFDPSEFSQFFKWIDETAAILSSENPDFLTFEDIRRSPLEPLAAQFVRATSEGGSIAVAYLYPPQRIDSESDVLAFRNAISKICPDCVVTGWGPLAADITGVTRRAMFRVLPLMIMALTLILVLAFRETKSVIISLLPVIWSVVVGLGAMKLFGIGINYVNAFAIPLVVGIAVDDGIHVAFRRRRSPKESPGESVQSLAVPISMTSLTTGVAFGSLCLSHYPGLVSFGSLVAGGVFLVMLSSLMILPAYLGLFEKAQS